MITRPSKGRNLLAYIAITLSWTLLTVGASASTDKEKPSNWRPCSYDHYFRPPSNNPQDQLILAISHCDYPKIRSILDSGLNPNFVKNEYPNHEKYSPLRYAIIRHYKEALVELLKHGADVNLRDDDGEGVMPAAAWSGTAEIVELLLAHGGKVNALDSDGQAPLKLAAGAGHVDIVRVLLKARAKINETDDRGNTPLLDAAWMLNSETVAELLRAGADPCIRNMEGNAARNLAENAHPLIDAVYAQAQNELKKMLPQNCKKDSGRIAQQNY